MIRTRYNSLVPALPSGTYRFGGTDFPFRPNTGVAFAAFLLGSVSNAEFTQAGDDLAAALVVARVLHPGRFQARSATSPEPRDFAGATNRRSTRSTASSRSSIRLLVDPISGRDGRHHASQGSAGF